MGRLDLTQERLRSLLHYDPETGRFVWLVRLGKSWPGLVAGCLTGNGYRHIRIDGYYYGAHRLAFLYMTGILPSGPLDHRNHIRDDNRWENIRPATSQQNSHNIARRKNNNSGATGVFWHKRDKRWIAHIADPSTRKRKYLGNFTDKQHAIDARHQAEVALFGEFRCEAA